MSEQRVTVGVMAQLHGPVGDLRQESHCKLEDLLESIGSRLKLSYGGDIIVYIHQDGPSYDSGLVLMSKDIMEDFYNELAHADLYVYQGTAKQFVDNWYDGADPSHLNITLEEAGYEENP